ncbi:MAG: hypothetical protein IPK79_01985 [Vampirovibrionales bacterium]|nr:hypothetical protein [Vampirovibrionales bacterium]
MYKPEISKMIKCFEVLIEDLSPKISLFDTLIFLHICLKEEYPLTELGNELGLDTVDTSRKVSALGDRRFAGGKANEGYNVVYTEADTINRAYKNALLTAKGKEIQEQLLKILKGQEQVKPPGKAKK